MKIAYYWTLAALLMMLFSPVSFIGLLMKKTRKHNRNKEMRSLEASFKL